MEGSSSKGKGRIVAGALVAATIVGGGTWWALGRGDATEAAPATTITVAPSTPVGIAAGSGGTGKAADGITPIGYENTCTGAVQAATNYHIALTDPVGATNFFDWTGEDINELVPGKPRKGLNDTLAYILDGDVLAWDDPAAPLAADLARPQKWLGQIAHPEWGAYRLASCGKVRMAVDVFSCDVASQPDLIKVPEDNIAMCGTTRYGLHWTGTPADWRIEKVQSGSDLSTLGVDRPSPSNAEPNPLPAERRKQLLKPLGPEWMEYANAPR